MSFAAVSKTFLTSAELNSSFPDISLSFVMLLTPSTRFVISSPNSFFKIGSVMPCLREWERIHAASAFSSALNSERMSAEASVCSRSVSPECLLIPA